MKKFIKFLFIVFIISVASYFAWYLWSEYSYNEEIEPVAVSDFTEEKDDGRDISEFTINTIDKFSLWNGGTKLRGVNIHQRRVYSDLDNGSMGSNHVGTPFTQKDFDKLAELGANYVEISHPGLFTEKPPYKPDEDVQKNLDNLLEKIAKANMFAVIAFRTGPGRSEFTFYSEDDSDWFDDSYRNEKVWESKEAQNAWGEMWKYTANRYKDNPVVAGYKLMVEPNSDEMALGIDEPEEFYPEYKGTLYDWNQFFPKITSAIREVDKKTPILVSAQGYGSLTWFPYLQPGADSRTVYVIHQYEPIQYTHYGKPSKKYSYLGSFDMDWDGEKDDFNKTWLQNQLLPIKTFKKKYNVPVTIGEFGPERWSVNADLYLDDEMSVFEDNNLNYAIWAWASAFDRKQRDDDNFDFAIGMNTKNSTADYSENNKLLRVLKKYWKKNSVRPYAEK